MTEYMWIKCILCGGTFYDYGDFDGNLVRYVSKAARSLPLHHLDGGFRLMKWIVPYHRYIYPVVSRGGGLFEGLKYCRCTHRCEGGRLNHCGSDGFRVVRKCE